MKKNNEQKKLIMLFVGAFLIMIFMMIFSHKASASDGDFFPMEQDENDLIPTNIENYIDNHYDNSHYYFCYYEKKEENGFQPGHYYYYFRLIGFNKGNGDNPLFAEIQSDNYHFSIYSITASELIYRRLSFYDNSPNNITDANNGSLSSFANLVSSKYTEGRSYISNFRLMTNNTDNAEIVLRFGPDPIPPLDIGSAIIPPAPILPEYPSGTTPPAQVPPSFTSTDYSWTTPPTFDSSSIVNAIGSIMNVLGWLANNLKEEFKNLTSNLKGFFEYIGKTIQYYGNAIISTLNNFIQNFYDNMKSLVEPIYTKIENLYNDFLEFADLFINPFDKEEFENQIDNCQLITQYNELLDNCEVLQQIFNETSEPDSFILYIDFENPFADSEHKIIHGEINFNWLVPLRPVYRPFLQVFVLMECFVGGFRILGNIIGGKAK